MVWYSGTAFVEIPEMRRVLDFRPFSGIAVQFYQQWTEIIMRILLFFMLFSCPLSLPPLLDARIIHVPNDSTTIQGGIDGAVDGDTVLVADGVYTGDGNRDIDFEGKAIVVMSENGPDGTIIDCGGSPAETHRGFKFTRGEGRNSVLSGFTITDGYAVAEYPGPPSGCGAGILIHTESSPVIENCLVENCTAEMFGGGMFIFRDSRPFVTNSTFRGNEAKHGFLIAGFGGGISIYQESAPEIVDCAFIGNTADDLGGGLAVNCLSSPLISGCYFIDNISYGDGGGISSGGSAVGENCQPVIVGCGFTGNQASVYGGAIGSFYGSSRASGIVMAGNSAGWGGGIAFYRGSHTMERTRIEGNTAQVGGGISVVDRADVTVSNCSIVDNSAVSDGGGIFSYASLIAHNCLIARNSAGFRGGGIYTDQDNQFQNCTIAENDADRFGGGVEVQSFSMPSFINCILWGDSPDEIHLEVGSSPVVIYSDIEGGWVGEGNIDADPRFSTFKGYEFLLHPASPCIDAGDPSIEDGFVWPDWYPNGHRSDMGGYGGPDNVNWIP